MAFEYETVLHFWFEEIEPLQWWKKDENFDAEIKDRFSQLHCAAIANELDSWRESSEGRLAEIIVIDQFSRNVFRDTPESFAFDGQALSLAQEAVRLKVPESLQDIQRQFLLMPYMHSESKRVHETAVFLFEKFAPANLDFELKHKVIIDRFGRYPHRNSILGRESTQEEIDFLKEPNSSF
jgi:uncharacterized protein (DUF924 family)